MSTIDIVALQETIDYPSEETLLDSLEYDHLTCLFLNAMILHDLTSEHYRVLCFICASYNEHGKSLAVSDIVEFSAKSRPTVLKLVWDLRKTGLIQFDTLGKNRMKNRTITPMFAVDRTLPDELSELAF
jgi:sulfur relay (sulfurtransferase) DsrC/TusE family protein